MLRVSSSFMRNEDYLGSGDDCICRTNEGEEEKETANKHTKLLLYGTDVNNPGDGRGGGGEVNRGRHKAEHVHPRKNGAREAHR